MFDETSFIKLVVSSSLGLSNLAICIISFYRFGSEGGSLVLGHCLPFSNLSING